MWENLRNKSYNLKYKFKCGFLNCIVVIFGKDENYKQYSIKL